MGRISDAIHAVRRDLHLGERTVEDLLLDKEYIQALDAKVARLEAENPRLAALYGTD